MKNGQVIQYRTKVWTIHDRFLPAKLRTFFETQIKNLQITNN